MMTSAFNRLKVPLCVASFHLLFIVCVHGIKSTLEKDIVHLASKVPDQNLVDKTFIEEGHAWFWTFPLIIETEEEELNQIKSFKSYLA